MITLEKLKTCQKYRNMTLEELEDVLNHIDFNLYMSMEGETLREKALSLIHSMMIENV